MREPYKLDVRVEVDDFDVEDLAHAINFAKVEHNLEVTAVVMRHVQYRHLATSAAVGAGAWGPDKALGVATIFGMEIIQQEDGLTPRERSIRRILRDEFRPTRDEQVAEVLREREETLDALKAQAAYHAGWRNARPG